jgi:hypothetical protein
MKLGAKSYDLAEDQEYRDGASFITIKPASPESVAEVLAADEDDDDGRSEWLWVILPNGDTILGLYPQGETYFATEKDHHS